MEYPLTKSQQTVFNAAKFTHDNILVLGEPGVGKSVLIRALSEDDSDDKKEFVLAAPTGLAALNINGRTLHSIFKLPTSDGVISPTYNVFLESGPAYNFIRYRIKHLIIDEISMVRADAFDYIDRLLRFIKRDERPFGGIQLIAIGDFYQLPPVVKREDLKPMREAGYDTPFIFSSKVFKNNFKILTLNEVLRQKDDPGFIELLAAARTGSLHPKHAKVLNTRIGRPDDLRIKLTCKNDEADAINRIELKKIQGQEVLFQATKFGEWPALPADPQLTLKIGAQVMVKMNGADKRPSKGTSGGMQESKVVNGTIGVILSIHDKPEGGDNDGYEINNDIAEPKFVPHVMIRTDSGHEVPIYIKRWERKRKIEVAPGEWEEEVVASYEQMPLALAWAISIHKSQGQSFDKAHIDLKSVFAPGQGYVALSRVRSMAGISFEAGVTTSMFKSNEDVDAFFEGLKEYANVE
jgi:ATP-dependent DNA helicase PIF1